MAETQNKTQKKDRIVIEYYWPIKELPGQEERKIILLSSEEAIERIAKALCSHEMGGCRECLLKNDKKVCLCVLNDEMYIGPAQAALKAMLK